MYRRFQNGSWSREVEDPSARFQPSRPEFEALPDLTVEAIIGRSFSYSTYNRFSSIKVALDLLPSHLFHVFATERTIYNREWLLYKQDRYGCGSWKKVSTLSVPGLGWRRGRHTQEKVTWVDRMKVHVQGSDGDWRERREGGVGGGGEGVLGGVYIRWMQGGRKTPFVCLAPVYFYLEQAADH